MSKPSDLLQGTLDLLILRTLALEPMHGWAIAARIQQTSQEVLQITQGALYPALHRLEQQGWLRAKWRKTETGRDAKFYALTAAGRESARASRHRPFGALRSHQRWRGWSAPQSSASASSRANTGRRKASVFPEPVPEVTTTL